MPLNRITLVVQPIPNLLNFAFLAALIAFAECLLPLLDLSNFPVLCRNISLYNPHYVPHLLCSSTRNHQLLKCNPICLSQILQKSSRWRQKIRARWKAKDTSAVEDRRLSACAVLHDRDEKVFQGGMERAPIFRDPQNIIKDERKLQRYCCSFCCQPQRILICCKKSSLPECLAQSSYWQTLLYLTYMCFLMFETKSFSIKTENMRRKCLNHCCYTKKTACHIHFFQTHLYVRACYYQFRQTTRELKTVFTFSFLSCMQSDLPAPTCQKLNLLVLDCK